MCDRHFLSLEVIKKNLKRRIKSESRARADAFHKRELAGVQLVRAVVCGGFVRNIHPVLGNRRHCPIGSSEEVGRKCVSLTDREAFPVIFLYKKSEIFAA